MESTVEAERDLVRLADFLAQHDEGAARRGAETIKAGLRSLAEMPSRARRLSGDRRELDIHFGNSGYVVQFHVDHDVVMVDRVFHMREDRSSD